MQIKSEAAGRVAEYARISRAPSQGNTADASTAIPSHHCAPALQVKANSPSRLEGILGVFQCDLLFHELRVVTVCVGVRPIVVDGLAARGIGHCRCSWNGVGAARRRLAHRSVI